YTGVPIFTPRHRCSLTRRVACPGAYRASTCSKRFLKPRSRGSGGNRGLLSLDTTGLPPKGKNPNGFYQCLTGTGANSRKSPAGGSGTSTLASATPFYTRMRVTHTLD